MSVGKKCIGEMGTKETGSSAYENAHQLFTHLSLRIDPDEVLKKDITVIMARYCHETYNSLRVIDTPIQSV
jgi:hypothetical protein